MKTTHPLAAAILFVLPVALSAADFEGKVTMKMNDPRGTPYPMTFSLREGFSRIDMEAEGQSVAMIYDHAKAEMTMLMPGQKMYLVQPIPKVAEMPAAAGGTADATFEKTNVTEKILGYDCVKCISKSKDATTEMWITDQLGTFMGAGGGNPMAGLGGRPGGAGRGPGGPGAKSPWEDMLRGKGMFPLRVITTTGGKESFRMEATSVEKQKLPASTFTPPADFQNLSNMMRGMGLPGGFPGTRP